MCRYYKKCVTHLPVLGLVYTLVVSFREDGLAVEGGDSYGQLGHGMQLAGYLQDIYYVCGDLGPTQNNTTF